MPGDRPSVPSRPSSVASVLTGWVLSWSVLTLSPCPYLPVSPSHCSSLLVSSRLDSSLPVPSRLVSSRRRHVSSLTYVNTASDDIFSPHSHTYIILHNSKFSFYFSKIQLYPRCLFSIGRSMVLLSVVFIVHT